MIYLLGVWLNFIIIRGLQIKPYVFRPHEIHWLGRQTQSDLAQSDYVEGIFDIEK